ncbi:phenylalanine--tRNA ligase subunit beta [Legionella dresdenensis]|uniref:Phenylalanine--tRNA ligase beta subunit n=1 Tax=Legionella dresdenensis TaxID=450200 RepID=A0ABV8CEN8_9GAMM
MKVSENWLREWVNPALAGQQLADLLTMAGLEVDSVSPVAGPFEQVIVAEVTATSAHPQADKLTVCEVNTGSERLQVVCGASNVRAGLKVALAKIGAQLPGGLEIKEARLRGELSQGMLCSATELGLTDSSEGILELDEDAPVGMELRQYLLLDDNVFDVDLTPNRADCLSVLGIAREISALTHTPLTATAINAISPVIDDKKTVTVQAVEACPQYCGRIIRQVNPQGVTPLWMRERLRRSGVRSINAIVDITNYVMLELGQPLHAFDFDTLQGGITVRYGGNNEELELLDGQTITLKENVLVIADDNQPLALAGVMGGLASAVTEKTTTIFLESAYFAPPAIAGVARSYGLFTDSSQRFERGVDSELAVKAIERAAELILQIAGGQAGPVTTATAVEHMPEKTVVSFKPEKVRQLTGLEITSDVMITMLSGLGMTVDASAPIWQVQVPSHRFDIRLDVDLIEEIIRLFGYDKIPGDIMITQLQAGVINPVEQLAMRLNQFFTARAYHETISYSFVDPQLQQALYPDSDALTLLNPISSELSQMRTGMWPGLIASMIHNIHRQQTAIRFFENGVVFEMQQGQLVEHPAIAGLLAGECNGLSWNENTRKYDFYDAKGDLQALFHALKLEQVEFVSQSHPALHPGKSAQILVAGQFAGWCGVLHPRIAEMLDLTDEVVLFELRMKSLLEQPNLRYQPISRFPQIRRDLSFLVDNTVSFAQIEQAVRSVVVPEWLKSFEVFDVYTGVNIPDGRKSLAVALTLQDARRTLIDNEINDVISAIIKVLEEQFSITLRE